MSRRIIIGGTDCTEAVHAAVAPAPPFSAAIADQLRIQWAGMLPAKPSRRLPRARSAVADVGMAQAS